MRDRIPKTLGSFSLVLFLTLASCQSPFEGPLALGSLTLLVQDQEEGRTILPGNNAIASYQATGSGPSGATVSQSSATGSFTIPHLAPGAWTFTVNGLDGGGTTVATGTSGTVTISAGSQPTVPVTLALVGGTGTLSLTVSWSSGKPITAVTGTLTPEGSSSPSTLNFTVSGTSATYTGTLATGSSVLVVKALNGSTVVARSRIEAVLIAKGKTSSWSATLADDQFVSSSKDITTFSLASPSVTGTISGTTIAVSVPYGTSVTSLTPSIAVSSGATVTPASGTSQNFTSPAAYTVTAVDGTTKTYTVTATVASPALVSAGVRDWKGLVISSDGTKMAALEYGGALFTSADGGTSWTQRARAGSELAYRLAASADLQTLVTIAGTNSSVTPWTSSNGGNAWTERASAGARYWQRVAISSDGAKMAAIASSEPVFTSSDGGATWTPQAASGGRNWNHLALSSNGNMLVATEWNGPLLTSGDGGITWTEQTAAGTRSWSDLALSSDGTKMAAAEWNGNNDTGVVLTSEDGGVTWTTRLTSKNWEHVAVSSDGSRLAATVYGGTLSVSKDGGVHWIEHPGVGSRDWVSIQISADGTTVLGAVANGYLYAFHP